MVAARSNSKPDAIATLLKAGAKIDAADSNGVTAFISAAANNHNPEVITTLLKAGADINAQDSSGETPLILAARLNRSHNCRTVKSQP